MINKDGLLDQKNSNNSNKKEIHSKAFVPLNSLVNLPKLNRNKSQSNTGINNFLSSARIL